MWKKEGEKNLKKEISGVKERKGGVKTWIPWTLTSRERGGEKE